MSHDTDQHPACRNCCRAAGDTRAPCRRVAALEPGPEPALPIDPQAAEELPRPAEVAVAPIPR